MKRLELKIDDVTDALIGCTVHAHNQVDNTTSYVEILATTDGHGEGQFIKIVIKTELLPLFLGPLQKAYEKAGDEARKLMQVNESFPFEHPLNPEKQAGLMNEGQFLD